MTIEPILFMYGPPGSGKSTAGRSLAQALDLAFVDLDHEISAQAGRSIPEVFEHEGEAGFRLRESAALQEVGRRGAAVVALGGGALLDPANRALAESTGTVVCLAASKTALQERLHKVEAIRPLLGKATEVDHKLEALLAARAEHYASFRLQVDTQALTPEQAAWQIQVELGLFRIGGMGKPYDVYVHPGGLEQLGVLMKNRRLAGPVALISDEHVAPFYLRRVTQGLTAADYTVTPVILPSGETSKTLASASRLWEEFLKAGLERGSTAVALGGGVISDLVGFAAAVYLRGMPWVAAPTSLLAMIDACLGGKTAIDLPQGKNLVGAFHPPALIVADPDTLKTLPAAELRNGLAEVLKHGLLRDPGLFAACARGFDALQSADWSALVRRALAVKVQYVQADPYEQGERAALNLGHTIGHAVEQASHFKLRHGEAIAIGILAAARLSQRAGLAQPGLVAQIAAALDALGLPKSMPPGLDLEEVLERVQLDKKKRGGQVRFVLPLKVGEVRYGMPVDLDVQILREVTL